METSRTLLYAEPRNAYIKDKTLKLAAFFLFVAIIFLFLILIVVEPSYLPSFLEELSQNVFYVLLVVFLVFIAFAILYILIVFALGRYRLAIYAEEIHLSFPITRDLKAILKGDANILRIPSIVSAKLEFREINGGPFSSQSPLMSWKCTFEVQSGKKISLYPSTPGCETPECLQAIKRFLRIVDTKKDENLH